MTDHIEAVENAIDEALSEGVQSIKVLAAIAIAAYQQAVANESTPAQQPVNELVEAVRAFMPSAQVAFLWPTEGVRDGEIDRYRERYNRILSALESAPAIPAGYTHRHIKRGTLYRVIGNGRLQIDGDLDMEKVTIYQGQDDQFWVRPDYEFNDRRFELIEAAPTPEAE